MPMHAHVMPMRLPAPAGVVKSTKMNRTIVVRRDYLHFIKKYARYLGLERRGSGEQNSAVYNGELHQTADVDLPQPCASMRQDVQENHSNGAWLAAAYLQYLQGGSCISCS